MRTTEQVRGVIPEAVIDGLILLRRSFLLTIFCLGFVFLGLATAVFGGVIAGMLATWGLSMILVSAVSYALLWFNRYR